MGNSTTQPNVTGTGAVKSIVVHTEAGDVTARRLAFIDYGELLRAVKKLPGGLGGFIDGSSQEDFKNSSTADIIMNLMPVLADGWSDLVGIIAVATDKDAEFIGQLDGADAIEVFAAVLDLNNYKKIGAALKKLMPQKPTENPSPEQSEATTTK
jgi:hypothetical protein